MRILKTNLISQNITTLIFSLIILLSCAEYTNKMYTDDLFDDHIIKEKNIKFATCFISVEDEDFHKVTEHWFDKMGRTVRYSEFDSSGTFCKRTFYTTYFKESSNHISYKEYEYRTQIVTLITDFNSPPTYPVRIDSTLIKESTIDTISKDETIKYYYNDRLSWYQIYENDKDGNNIKLSAYSADSILVYYTNFTWKNKKMVLSEKFNKENGKIGYSNRTYENGKQKTSELYSSIELIQHEENEYNSEMQLIKQDYYSKENELYIHFTFEYDNSLITKSISTLTFNKSKEEKSVSKYEYKTRN